MHAHDYPIDQVKEVALTTIKALNRADSTASDADFNDGNFARLDAVSKLSGLFAENPKILWHWLPMMGVEITTDQIDLDETDTNNVVQADIHHCTQMRKVDKEIQEKADAVLTKATRVPF